MTMGRRPGNRVLRLLARIVPPDARVDWLREWGAELEHDAVRGGAEARGRLAGRLAAAAEDALRLGVYRLPVGPGFRDVRFAARALIRSPLFTAAVVVTLGLGVGANAAIFTAVDAVLLQSLPYPDADRIVQLVQRVRDGEEVGAISTPDFNDLAERSRALDHLSLRVWVRPTYQAEQPVALDGAAVSSGYFRLFGTLPHLGRYFLPEEDEPGQGPAVVLSHGAWQRVFGGDPELVGGTVTLDGQPHVVVGVAEAGLRDPVGDVEIWTSRPDWIDLAERGQGWLLAFARVAPHADFDQATDELGALSRDLAREYPDGNADRAFGIVSLQDRLAEPVRPALLVLLAAVGLVLLITCANVANLILVRSAGREREMAVRISLGAGRGRLAGQLLVEGVLLAFLGGAAGLALAAGATRALGGLGAPGLPRLADPRVDGTVLLYTLLMSGATGVVFGLVPLLNVSRADPSRGLREGGRSGEGRRARAVRRALVAGELAVSAVLLVGAGLLLRSLVHLTRVDTGVRPEGVVVLHVQPPAAAFPTAADLRVFYDGVRSGIARLPGVEAVGAVSLLPFTVNTWYELVREDAPPPGPGEVATAQLRVVGPGYFQSLGIPLVRGRLLDARDEADAPPALVVDEALARRFFPGEDPVGKRITIPWGAHVAPSSHEVVGVVGDVRHEGPASLPEPTLYALRGHDATPPWLSRGLWITVRASGDPLAVARAATDVVWGLERTVPVTEVGPYDRFLARHRAGPGFQALLIGAFALLATLLASVGIWGVVAYAVARRGHEIGVRRALGAEAGDVVRLVLGEGALLVALGIPAGLLLAAVGARVLRSLLFGVEPGDPLTFGAVAVGLALVALAAAWLPARRAATVPPWTALRDDV